MGVGRSNTAIRLNGDSDREISFVTAKPNGAHSLTYCLRYRVVTLKLYYKGVATGFIRGRPRIRRTAYVYCTDIGVGVRFVSLNVRLGKACLKCQPAPPFIILKNVATVTGEDGGHRHWRSWYGKSGKPSWTRSNTGRLCREHPVDCILF